MDGHLLWRSGDQALYARRDAISICLGKDRVYTFTPEGRPFSFFRAGDFYQRGLGDVYLHKGRHTQPGQPPRRFRQPLEPTQAQALLAEVRQELTSLKPSNEAANRALATVLAWTPEQLAADGGRFAGIYQPISILPPDQYLSIVLQLSEGCSYNRCAFCNFYKDRPFQIKSPEAFAAHALAVREFLGPARSLRKGLFLADGDALMTPQPRLKQAMRTARELFGPLPFYSFMDAFRPQAKSLSAFEELAELGLRRIYLGIETGDAALLAWLNKPGNPELMHAEACKIKAAGLSLGLIFMVGAGGQTFADQHREASINWLRSLPLSADDRIFLSEFVPHPDQPYAAKAAAEGIVPLTPSEIASETGAWRQALQNLPAKKVPYHLQEFIY